MKYFDNIEWVGFNHSEQCTALVDKVFPDYYVIMYAHTGKFFWQLDNQNPLILEAPVAWWAYPDHHFKFGMVDDNTIWDHRFISFRGSRVDTLIEGGLFDITTARPFKPISNAIQFCDKFDELLAYLEAPLCGNSRAIHLLEGLLLLTQEEQPSKRQFSPTEKKVKVVVEQVKKNPEVVYDFHEISHQLQLSYTHFRRIFKMMSGYPPSQFVIRMKMKTAANLLRQSELGIKEIASRSGFDDIYYFSKMFKQTYKRPPGQFRKGAVNV
jgi:AraC-like DNA-binding protein